MSNARIIPILSLCLAATPASADMIDTSGLKSWEHCALCHGVDGNSRVAKFPKLAGQRYGYLVKQLKDFKSEKRQNDGGPMLGMSDQLSLAALTAAARYYSDLPPPPPSTDPVAPAILALGKRIFQQGLPAAGIPACVSCHGDGASGRPDAPRLEAQHAAYLEKQLDDFRNGDRSNDLDGVMRGIVAKLPEAGRQAVAAYLAGQPRKTVIAP